MIKNSKSRLFAKVYYCEKCHKESFAKINFLRGHSRKIIPKISRFFNLAKVSSFKVVKCTIMASIGIFRNVQNISFGIPINGSFFDDGNVL